MYSDADAPHWAGWHLMQDYQDGDSRCDVVALRRLLDADGDGVTTQREAEARIAQPATQQYMRGVVAKFPTEWHRGSVASRWRWLTSEGPNGTNPNSLSASTHLSQADFPEFHRHSEALAFWEDAALEGIEKEHWHFHPTRFIEHFGKCGWWSTNEIQRIFPNATNTNAERFSRAINLVTRKYLGESSIRRSHFLGQTGHETGDLSGTMAENGNSKASRQYETNEAYFRGPDGYTYFQPASGYERIRNMLGNEYSPHGTGDGVKFRGRGSLQITGRAHYSEYWVYRGWLDPESFDANWWTINGWWNIPRNPRIRPAEISDPQRISVRPDGNEYTPIDVGGAYWVRKSLNQACEAEDPWSPQAPRSDNVSAIEEHARSETASRNRKESVVRCNLKSILAFLIISLSMGARHLRRSRTRSCPNVSKVQRLKFQQRKMTE